MSTIIEIAGKAIDLARGTIVTQSLKSFSIGEMQSRFVNFTNQFKVPRTPTNDAIFENSGNSTSTSDIPYNKQAAKIIQDGIETVSNGVVSIDDVDSVYNISIFSGSKSFFEAIGNKKLSDLVFVDKGNAAFMASRRAVTSGIVYPVAYYGTQSVGPSDVLVDIGFIYLHSIIDSIFTDAGFEKDGDIFSDAKYLRYVVSCLGKNAKYQPSFIEKRRIDVFVKTTQGPVLVPAGDGLKVNFTGYYKTGTNPIGYWSTNEMLCNDPNAPANASLMTLLHRWSLNIVVTGGTVNIGLIVPTYGGGSLQVNGVGSGVYSYESDPDDSNTFRVLTNPSGGAPSLSLFINIASGTPTVTITDGQLEIYSNGTFTQRNAVGNEYVYYNEILPDMTQANLIKEIAIRYGLIFSEKFGVVTAKTIDAIIADRANAIDWTAKRVNVKNDSIKFTPLEYAQENYFEYTNSDDDVNERFGEGFFSIANLNAELSKTIYTSPFDNVTAIYKSNIAMASIPLYDNIIFANYDYKFFDNSTGDKLLLVRDPYSYDTSVPFPDGGIYSDYKVAYFQDPNQDENMGFQDEIDGNYPLFIEALQKAKIVTHEYLLTPIDIANFDFLYPVYDNGEYFIVNEIKNFINGVPTTVEMFKV